MVKCPGRFLIVKFPGKFPIFLMVEFLSGTNRSKLLDPLGFNTAEERLFIKGLLLALSCDSSIYVLEDVVTANNSSASFK